MTGIVLAVLLFAVFAVPTTIAVFGLGIAFTFFAFSVPTTFVAGIAFAV
jgi:hypothetical protein